MSASRLPNSEGGANPSLAVNAVAKGTELMKVSFQILALAVTVAINPSPSVARTANADSRSLSVNFEQRFTLVSCPGNAPPGSTCLEVTGKAESPTFGRLAFERTVLFDARKFDKLHPTCIPDETSGTLVTQDGSLNFRAPGSVCLADGTASYGLIITGGTGALRGMVGGGRITVPPEVAPGEGRELWQVELFGAERPSTR